MKGRLYFLKLVELFAIVADPNLTSIPMSREAVQDYILFGTPVHLAATAFCVILMCFSLALALHHFVQTKKRLVPPQSPFASPPGSLHDMCQQFQPVTSTTSVSDISLYARQLHSRRQYKRRKRGLPSAVTSSSIGSKNSSHLSRCGASPEDFLRDSKLFQSSPSSSAESSPKSRHKLPAEVEKSSDRPGQTLCQPSQVLPKDTRFVSTHPMKHSLLTPGIPRRLPVATVSPQPARVLNLDHDNQVEKQLDTKPRKTLDEGVQERKSKKWKNDTINENESNMKRSSVTSKSEDSGRNSDMENTTCSPGASSVLQTTSQETLPNDDSRNRRSSTVEPVQLRTRPGRGRGEDRRMMASLSEFSLSGADAEFEYDYYDYGIHNAPGSYFSQYPDSLSWLPPFLPVQPPYNETDYPMQDFGRNSAEESSLMPPSSLLQESSADSLAVAASGGHGGHSLSPMKTPTETFANGASQHGKCDVQSPTSNNS